MKRVHVFIMGEVQGVGYRQFVKGLAKKYGAVGWVRNIPDGRVEAIIQSKEEILLTMLPLLQTGPFLAKVTDIVVTWEESLEDFRSFDIR